MMLNLCIFHTIAYYWSVALFWALRLRLQGTANADHLFCFQCPASGDKHGPNLCCTRNICRRVCGLGWERGCSHDGYYGMGGVGRVAGTFLGRAQMLDATEHQGYVGWARLAC